MNSDFLEDMQMITHHAALIYTIILSATADGDPSEAEFDAVKNMISGLPIFEGFNLASFQEIAGACTDLLTEEDGLDAAIDIIRQSLPPRLAATAYTLSLIHI